MVEGGATAAVVREVVRVRGREVGRVGVTTVDSEVEVLEEVEGVEELERKGREGREEERVSKEERNTSVAEAGWGRLGGIAPWGGG